MRSWSLFIATFFLLAAADARAQASITTVPLGAEAVSADGSVMVGSSGGGAARWVQGVGTHPLGNLPGLNASQGLDVSADGTIAVGVAGNLNVFPPDFDQAFRWTQAEGMVAIGDLPGGDVYSWANGISADGSVITGNSVSAAGLEGFRWTEAGGMVGSGIPSGFASVSAYGISADGSTIVGGMQTSGGVGEAFYWTEEAGVVSIGGLQANGTGGFARDASADGSMIVGYSNSSNGLWEAFRWTEAGGMVGLGDLPGGSFQSFAYGVSDDGSIAVGESRIAAGTEAVVWDANGIHPLKTVLQALGVDVTGWTLTTALAISADGNTITGNGRAPGSSNVVAFVAVIPEPGHAAMLTSGVASLVFLRRCRDRQLRA